MFNPDTVVEKSGIYVISFTRKGERLDNNILIEGFKHYNKGTYRERASKILNDLLDHGWVFVNYTYLRDPISIIMDTALDLEPI